MVDNSKSEGSDEEGLEAAKDEIDEEPEPGLGPGADGDEEDAESNSDTTDE